MKCTSDSCTLKPELSQSGWGSPHPIYYCPICRECYWHHSEKKLDESGRPVSVQDELLPYPPETWGHKTREQLLSQYNYAWLRKNGK